MDSGIVRKIILKSKLKILQTFVNSYKIIWLINILKKRGHCNSRFHLNGRHFFDLNLSEYNGIILVVLETDCFMITP